MDEKILIITDRSTLKQTLSELMKKSINSDIDFESDRINMHEAAKLACVSIPTLKKMVESGRVKEYNTGRKKYYLKSELIKSLTSENNE